MITKILSSVSVPVARPLKGSGRAGRREAVDTGRAGRREAVDTGRAGRREAVDTGRAGPREAVDTGRAGRRSPRDSELSASAPRARSCARVWVPHEPASAGPRAQGPSAPRSSTLLILILTFP